MPYTTTTRTFRPSPRGADSQPTATSGRADGANFGAQQQDVGRSRYGGGAAAAPSQPTAPAGGRYSTPRGDYVRSRQGGGDDAPKQPAATASSGFNPKPAGRGGVVANQKGVVVGQYDKIKADLLSRNGLFEDPEFPATDSSLFFKERLPIKIEWKRPREFCPNPEFITGGASRFDVRQGQLGDCWLLASIASLSMHQELFSRVVSSDQTFSSGDYCGMFRFNFWSFGEWKEVVVDDRLPTSKGQLIFMHSAEQNEFWSALLEKAYAKLMGSYEALKGGTQSEAMEDFTGGITENFDLKQDAPQNLFDIMCRAQTRSSLMGCSIDADPRQLEARLPNGLIMGHAYSITDVKAVDIKVPGKQGKIQLIRIRNPWGNEEEWKGAWGDKSNEWSLISEAERERLGLSFSDDGEFWMSFQDFVKNFEKLEICHLGPQSMEGNVMEGTQKRRWEMCLENGAWKRRLNAGGCRNYIDTFWTNPQFRVQVVDPDENDDDNKGTVIIGLMQMNMRRKMKEGAELNTIGYTIYRLEDPNCGPLDIKFFKYNASVAKSPAFINTREVCGRHKLAPGIYCIVPSTFEPDQEAEFLLRIFSEKPNESGELDEETDMDSKPTEPIPPQDEKQISALRDAFKAIAGEDMEVDAFELKGILDSAFKKGSYIHSGLSLGEPTVKDEFKFDGFSIETCRSMVAMMDADQSGKLGFEEFKVLWNDLRLWKTIFKKFDADKSGNCNSYELRQTLHAIGFSVSNSVFNSLVMRYSTKGGVINFDDYILICARLKTVFETFKAQPQTPNGEAIFKKDVFIQCIMYA
jgi:calpain, invertebrate